MYVCGFAFCGSEVALVTKAKPEWQRGKLNGVGGKIEEGETPHQAMRREFLEETGIETFESDWQHFLTLNTKGEKVYFFRAEMSTALPIKYLPDEPVNWWAIANVANKIPNLDWLIPFARIQRVTQPAEVWE